MTLISITIFFFTKSNKAFRFLNREEMGWPGWGMEAEGGQW